jgi:hypothetical protein
MKKTIDNEQFRSEKPEVAEDATVQKNSSIKHEKFYVRDLFKTKKRTVLTSGIIAVLIFVVLFAVPMTRYGILGTVIKKEISVTVIDAKTKQPVTDASVTIGSISKQTDKNGVVKVPKISVGTSDVHVTKRFYQNYEQTYMVPLLTTPSAQKIELTATGRQVTVVVVDKITGRSMADAVVASGETKATTSAKGSADLVLAPMPDTQKITITKSGYNLQEAELKVVSGVVNTYALTPAGSIYYLSNATGKINVMKSNLDGSNPTVAVQATGKESGRDTSLLSARDWKYSALIATRADKQAIYLVDSDKGDLSVLDEGNASFVSVGWFGHNFIYTVYRDGGNVWESNRQLVKSFNADTRKITVIDQNIATGSNIYDAQYQTFGSVYILDNEIVYTKSWQYGYYNNLGADKTTSLVSADPRTGSKKTIKSFPVNNSVDGKLYEPQGIYIRVAPANGTAAFYEYEDGAVKTVTDTSDSKFYDVYSTYLVSPSGKKTLWAESRDGKNTLFIGDKNGTNAKQIATLSDYTPYGWYGADDQYILLTKDGSELYVAPAGNTLGDPLKVTEYYKTRSYPGYGYGYGGQ